MSSKNLALHTLVLGGASSGKSAYAEARVLETGLSPIYVATAQVYDTEMQSKVAKHRERRDDRWHTIEAPTDLPAALATACEKNIVLIDCATLWLTNLMLAEADIPAAEDALFTALRNCPCPCIIVSNEVGYGIVPENAMARQFRGLQGGFNQRLAERVGTVVLVAAGLPLTLKALE